MTPESEFNTKLADPLSKRKLVVLTAMSKVTLDSVPLMNIPGVGVDWRGGHPQSRAINGWVPDPQHLQPLGQSLVPWPDFLHVVQDAWALLPFLLVSFSSTSFPASSSLNFKRQGRLFSLGALGPKARFYDFWIGWIEIQGGLGDECVV